MITILKPQLTNLQKEALVLHLLNQIGNSVEFWDETQKANESLQGISVEEARLQYALWLEKLPGKVWDKRLPEV